MTPIILFRPDRTNEEELAVAREYFEVVTQRHACPKNSLVIGRYSVLPFYRELATDLELAGSRLVNSVEEHEYIADVGRWVEDLGEWTPKTWTRLEDLPEQGPFVLKGETNSKKNLWSTHMYAADKRAAVEVWLRLKEDFLLEHQQIYIRQFVPLRTFMQGINGMPITEEYRFFCYGERVLSGGYYWSNYVADLPEVPRASNVPKPFLHAVLRRLRGKATFYVVDVARRADGGWMVVELNDAQMSGPSEVKPHNLYKALADELRED